MQASRYHVYRWFELAAGVAAISAAFIVNSDATGLVATGAILYACVRDWDGVRTLRGMVRWRQPVRFWLVVLFIVCYPALFVAYLSRAIADAIAWHKGQPERTQAEIDRLERELGITKGQGREAE